VITRVAIWLPVLGFALALAIVEGFSPPARADEPKDAPTEGKLPKGAKLGLNDSPLVFHYGSNFMPQPPDYKALVRLKDKETLQRYDIATLKPLEKEPEKPANFVSTKSFILSGDGKRFATLNKDSISVRDVATDKEIARLKRPVVFETIIDYGPLSYAFSADGKSLAHAGAPMGDTNGPVVWDVEKAEVIFKTGGEFNGSARATLSRDGKLLAIRALNTTLVSSGPKQDDDPNRTVWIYDVAGGKQLLKVRVTPGEGTNMIAVAFSPDNTTLAASCGEGVIDVFDLKTGKAKPVFLGRAGQGLGLAISEDGKTLAAISTDGTIQRWNLADGKAIDVTEGPSVLTWRPHGIAFADNRVIAWGFTGNCPMVWEAPSGNILTQLPEHTYPIVSIAFVNEGKEILTSDLDGRVVRWDAKTGKPIGEVKLKPSHATLAARVRRGQLVHFTSDGTQAVASSVPGAVYDVATGEEEFALPRGLRGATNLRIQSDDPTKVMSAVTFGPNSSMTKFIVWDLNARQKLIEGELKGAVSAQSSFAVSPSGKRMVTAGYKPPQLGVPKPFVVTGWDLTTGKKLSEVEDVAVTGQAYVAAVNDTYAVLFSGTGRLRAYDYETGRGGDEFATGKEQYDHVIGPVLVIAGGKQFVSTGAAEEQGLYAVKIHEWPSGRVLHTFTGHHAPISAMAVSPDGKTLATGSQDTTVLLWDLSEVK
jgi:WD40 repeat protein